jgi:hypothetical protein
MPVTIDPPSYIKAKPFYPKNYKSNNNINLYSENKNHYEFKPNLRKSTKTFFFINLY